MAVKARSIVIAVGDLLSFPNPVNEKAARTVAFVVMVVSAVGLATSTYWLFVPLAYGFVARVLTGPRLSPLGRLASAVLTGGARPVDAQASLDMARPGIEPGATSMPACAER